MVRHFLSKSGTLAAVMAASLALTGCGAHKDSDEDLTPTQQMAKLVAEPGVVKLKDGLAYKVLESGPKNGEQPKLGDVMMLIYEADCLMGPFLTAPNSTATALICRCR